MKKALTLLALSLAISAPLRAGELEARDYMRGLLIPDESYCDQPYIVETKDGKWVCTMTTGAGGESADGQHVVAVISEDQGRTWSKSHDIEPAGAVKSSWVIPLITPGGRIYAFYNYNGDNVKELNGSMLGVNTLLGWYCYRYSDDGGKTWSKDRYRLPLPVAEVDRLNDFGGKVQLFWGIDKPIVVDGAALFAFTRMQKFPHDHGEGWIYKSDNILTETDPARIKWELLPTTPRGIRSDKLGVLQEEHNIVPLSKGGLYCMYRTKDGYPVDAYSQDGGRTWSEPQPAAYTPGGRVMKTPRACPMVWQAANGKYLFWYHNTSLQLRNKGRWRKDKSAPYTGRDLIWLAGGVEKDGQIHWSQPELLTYHLEGAGASYPDLIERDGRYLFSSTNKKEARIVEAPSALLEGMWHQADLKTVATKGLVVDLKKDLPASVTMPKLTPLAQHGGFALDFWVWFDSLQPGQVLLDSRDGAKGGIAVTIAKEGELTLSISDGTNTATCSTDPGRLVTGQWQHVVFIVDGGPKMISVVVDGELNDGGKDRFSGMGRFLDQMYDQPMGNVAGSTSMQIAPSLKGRLGVFRLYDRYLTTSEAIGNFQAGGPR